MTSKGFTRNFKALEILTEEQMEAIHRASLEVLEVTGVRFESDRALELMKKHGCKVDFQNRRVRFPPGLVEDCLRRCPSSFRLRARDRANDLFIGGNTTYFCAFPGMRTIDLETWEQRVPTIQDNHDAVRVLDALPYVHLAPSYTPYCELEGVAPVMLLPVSTWSRMKYFTKPSRIGSSTDSHIWEIQMAKEIDVDVFAAMEAAPPLTWYGDAIDCAWACAENGFPVEVGCGCVMGGTGPATIAGALVQSNAEIMSGIVLVQLVREGTGILSNAFVAALNMRTGTPAAGGIEISLFQAAFNQIWRGRYNIPTMVGGTGPSSSQRIDFQTGYEKGISTSIAAVAASSVINLIGGIHVELTYHPAQSVLDNDIAGMIGRFLEGVSVNPETIALEVIQKVGPIPGHYLTQKHTREWWKKEHFIPDVADRLSYPEWLAQGKKSALENAVHRVSEILATHQPSPPLSSTQEENLDRILAEAEKYYRDKEML
jgi:trimethylamine---corrinoid protein Co-methyltransferase